jgi:osmotically-inducible protein OsmY
MNFPNDPDIDSKLEAVINELLSNSKELNKSDITVKVSRCDVTLSGTVKSPRERDYAQSVVTLVHGVGGINLDLSFP